MHITSDENISHAMSRSSKSNGMREGHHVTFAESHTEHVASESVGGDNTVITKTETVHTVSNSVNGHGDGSYIEYTHSSHNCHTPPTTTDHHNVSVSSTSPIPQMAPLTPIIKLQRSASTESHENPFTADGELSKKADYIISHSTISRTELKITDPDTSKTVPDETIKPQEAGTVQSARPNDIAVSDQNGKPVEEAITPSSVQVVEAGNASQPEPQQAEQVKLKDNKKCACCTVM